MIPQPIAELAPEVPWLLARTISRCLAKAPEDRWQTANDLLFQLRTIGAAPGPSEAPRSRPVGRLRSVERGLWAAVVIASMAGTWMWAGRQGVPREHVRQADGHGALHDRTSCGHDVRIVTGRTAGVVAGWSLSCVCRCRDRWHPALVASSLGCRARASVLSGTEGANTPFWSPDSQWVGFFAGNSLKKLRVSTGIAQTVASSVSTFGGASWSTTDVILFPAATGGLSRVSAQGGSVSQVTEARAISGRSSCPTASTTSTPPLHLPG